MTSLQPDVREVIERWSMSTFKGLWGIIGGPDRVAMRRNVADTIEVLRGILKTDWQKISLYLSGSMREGFKFDDSDVDAMVEMEYFRVFWMASQCRHNNPCKHFPLLFDGSTSPPGYGKLCVLMIQPQDIINMDLLIKNRKYLSSDKVKDLFISFMPQFKEHGPCANISFGSGELDVVNSLVSDYWPQAASTFLKRSTSWPKPQILKDIVKNRCHLVPIGNKIGFFEDVEWRISFTVAEHKLIYSMNHCEFLLYGLLKIFLKEVINKDCSEEDKLLCSYDMKIVVFWVLQQNGLLKCCPQNLLQYFWVCFKRILKCVYEGVCHKFFIPQNNMFRNKVFGSNQRKLFLKLHKLYEKGLSCLLECPSIKPCLVTTLESRIPSNTVLKPCTVELFQKLESADFWFISNYYTCLNPLKMVAKLIHMRLPEIQISVVRRVTVSMFKHAMFIMLSLNSNTNKSRYKTDQTAWRTYKFSVKHGCISDPLYYAMYCYMTFRYEDALRVIERVKLLMVKPYTLHLGQEITRYMKRLREECP